MDFILLLFVAFLCTWQGVKEYNSEEQSKVFTKYPIKVNDVKAYNHFCGKLILIFGVVAEITMIAMTMVEGWVSIIFIVLILAEAYRLMVIYRKGEKKYRVK